MHARRVLHCDISARNLLLDAEFNIKLSDFQGRLLELHGEAEEDGPSVENTKSFMPRVDSNHADWKIEIFPLPSAFYYIIEGCEPYPDLDPNYDEEQIVKRFISRQSPEIAFSPMNYIMHKCWAGEYGSMDAVLQDLDFIHGDSMF